MNFDCLEIEEEASQLRKKYDIQTYGIKDIFFLVEQMKIDLIRYPFGKDKLLGFATIYEGKKIIVSNSSEILSREIYTIAHEIGHIIFDFEDYYQKCKIDIDNNNESIAEKRAFYFADCLLMPKEKIERFIKVELKKNTCNLNSLDIIRMQIEFMVSYNALLMRLYNMKLITKHKKNELFSTRSHLSSKALFEMLNADDQLLKSSDKIKVPSKYFEYAISNYKNKYISYESLEKAFGLLDKNPIMFKIEDEIENDEDIEEIFKEYE